MTPQHPPTEWQAQRLGMRLAAHIHQQADALPSDITERLRVARQLAVAHAQARARVATPPRIADADPAWTVQVNAQGTAQWAGGPFGRPSRGPWLTAFASALPLVILVMGLLWLHHQVQHQHTQAEAERDVSVLLDELPPDAYSDPGFLIFLKNNAPSAR